MPTAVSQPDLSSLDAIPERSWAALSQRRIYFGHKSVGDNIIAGIAEITRLKPQIKLRIVQFADPGAFAEPGFVHSHLGANGDPESKIRAFVELMDAGFGERTDLAMFKFCYVDIAENTDPARLFESYRSAMTDLGRRFPRVTFAHITTPLTTVQAGVKAAVKRLLGKPLWGQEQNLQREAYNDLMRAAYGPSGRLIDLARFESNRADGTAASFTFRGNKSRSLAVEYTDDGGHLNVSGRLVAASGMLSWLAANAGYGEK